MTYVIFDLEATCWAESHELLRQEIIEIGAFHMDVYGEVTDHFSRFIKPVVHPFLSPFCQELTTIRQEDVDRASPFDKVFHDFTEWVYSHDDADAIHFCSWGKLDIELIRNDCALHHVSLEWGDHFYDLKKRYNALKGYSAPIGFQKALRKEDIEFEGTPHRALDDAYNLCKLFHRYIDVWGL